MSETASQSKEKFGPVQHPRRQVDRRRAIRRYLTLPVRLMDESGVEYSGELVDISAEGMRLTSVLQPILGDMIITYVDGLGRFEGKVIRTEAQYFAMHMSMSKAKIERLEQSLNIYFSNLKEQALRSDRRLGAPDRRRSDRIMGDLTEEILGKTSDDVSFKCAVKNISLSGIEIVTEANLILGENVSVGLLKGFISRKTPVGYVILQDDEK